MLIWKTGADGVRTFINNSFFRLAGEDIKEANSGWFSIVHPDDLSKCLNKYYEALKFGKSFRTRYRILNNSGEYRWMLEIGMPLSHISKDLTGYIGVCIDITMRKTLKKALKEKLQVYKSAFEINNMPTLVLSLEEFGIVDANPAAEKFYGYSRNKLKKMEMMDLITGIDINREIKKTIEEKQRLLSLAENFKDGEIKYAKAHCSLMLTVVGNLVFIMINEDIDNKEILAQLAYKDYHDELTGLYNRKYFELQLKHLDNEIQLPLSIIIGDVNNMKLINNSFGYDKGDEVLKAIAQILRLSCRKEDIICRIGGDEFALILPGTREKDAAKICNRIREKCKSQDQKLLKYEISLGTAARTKKTQDIVDICREAEDKMYKNKLSEGTSLRSSLIDSLRKTIEERTWETEAHAERMKDRALKLGRLLNLSNAELDELALLATLHDIGKIGIPDSILSKKGVLNTEEREIMKKHSEIGYRIAAASPELSNIANAILYHHEHWDGNGYPHGLKGKEIPITSRIISVIDAYDAMTNDRVYHAAISKEKAVEEITNCSGKQFDPRVVEAFLKMM
ncbi:MAG TPA: diguanylate cyclase [Clostridiales bacterium]|nr:diguanylate cyclase [Clostridiales bacterium]